MNSEKKPLNSGQIVDLLEQVKGLKWQVEELKQETAYWAEINFLKGFIAGKAEGVQMLISENKYELLVKFSDWLREQAWDATELENSDELVARFMDEIQDDGSSVEEYHNDER